VGRDGKIDGIMDNGDGFNPRARVGRDTDRAASSSVRRRFNPRARVGRDINNA